MIEQKDKSIKLKLYFISYKIKYRKLKVIIKRTLSKLFIKLKNSLDSFKEKRKAKLEEKINNIKNNSIEQDSKEIIIDENSIKENEISDILILDKIEEDKEEYIEEIEEENTKESEGKISNNINEHTRKIEFKKVNIMMLQQAKKIMYNLIKSFSKAINKVFHFFDFTDFRKKIKKSVLVCFVLGIIGVITYLVFYIINTPALLTKKYYTEISDIIDIEYNNVIKILKVDTDHDAVEDYICLVGTGIYDTAKSHIGNDNLTGYKNVGIIYINGSTKSKIIYESKKVFYTDVDVVLLKFNESSYIFVNSVSSQDVIFAKVYSEEIIDIIEASFSGIPKGYNISCRLREEDTTKLIVVLDKDENEYLEDKKDEYVIDLENNNIDITLYRYSYLKDKFSYFECFDVDNDGLPELIGVQNVLYLNNSKFSTHLKTVGKVKVVFKLIEDKFKYNNVFVEF